MWGGTDCFGIRSGTMTHLMWVALMMSVCSNLSLFGTSRDNGDDAGRLLKPIKTGLTLDNCFRPNRSKMGRGMRPPTAFAPVWYHHRQELFRSVGRICVCSPKTQAKTNGFQSLFASDQSICGMSRPGPECENQLLSVCWMASTLPFAEWTSENRSASIRRSLVSPSPSDCPIRNPHP
jgi:hypothetical protein